MTFALSRREHDARHRIAHELDDGTRLVWELLDDDPRDALVAEEVELRGGDWVARLDQVVFPPGGIAYRHVHPGPGIRYLVAGELTIDRGDTSRTYTAGEAWFEGADDPVLATAAAEDETAFVRVLLLPAEWAGKRTIRYLDPADEAKPRLQRAEILLEEPIAT